MTSLSSRIHAKTQPNGVKGDSPDDFDVELAVAAAAEKSFVFQHLIDATGEMIWMIDLQGNVVIENEPNRHLDHDLFGVDLEQSSLEQRLAVIASGLTDPDGYLAEFQELSADAVCERTSEWKHRQSGRIFRRYSGPVRNQSGAPIGRVFVVNEVTLERESERLKDEFIALVSHELRTPLTSIIGYIDLLRDEETGELNDQQDTFIKTIERNTSRLQRIVGDLLFAAQADAGRIIFEKGSCPLADVARQCVEAAGPAADARDIYLTLEIEAEPVMIGDRERLSQVLDNLITNALKFSDPEGRVTVTIGASEGQAVMTVQDTGMGMSQSEQERLFQRFYRTDRATEQAIQGTGLGLAICKLIVERHDGSISVQSEQNKGSTFQVSLPLGEEA